MKNFALFLGGCLSLYLAWITGTGEILNYINFADPLNDSDPIQRLNRDCPERIVEHISKMINLYYHMIKLLQKIKILSTKR